MLAPTLHFFLLGCCCWWCFLIQNHQMHVVRVSMCNRFFFGYERHSIYLLFASFFCLWSHSLHLVYMNVLCMWRLPFLAFFFSTLYCHHFSEGNENIKRKVSFNMWRKREWEEPMTTNLMFIYAFNVRSTTEHSRLYSNTRT